MLPEIVEKMLNTSTTKGAMGGVESNQTNFELIFLEFFELKMGFQINRIEKFSNRTNRIILPSNRISN